MIKITENEKKVLKAFMLNDIVGDTGWRNEKACTWTDGFNRDVGMSGKVYSGVFSGMCAKGLVWTNGESWGITAAAREVCEAIEAESNTPAPVVLVDAEVEELKNELKWREHRLVRAQSSARLMAERLDKAVRQLAEAKKDMEEWTKEVAERKEMLDAVRVRLDGLMPVEVKG